MTPDGNSKVGRYVRRLAQLKSDRMGQGWDAHWRDLAEYFAPERGRYLSNDTKTQHNDGRKKHGKILNGTSIDARRTLAGGLQGGLTSPSRPWFKLGLEDKELMEFEPVKEYLHLVRDILLSIFARSNFYGAAHNMYDECGVFGTSGMIIDEDPRTIIRCRPFTIGEFWMSLDSSYRPGAVMRQFPLTAEQMVGMFGLDAVSQQVKSAYENRNYTSTFEVVHILESNSERKPGMAYAEGMAFKSCYFEPSGREDKVLRESGYRVQPFVIPRWNVVGVDTYGFSPGMGALGDVKQLQKMEEKKLKALDKMVDPPMNGPASMRSIGGDVRPGAINWVPEGSGDAFRAAHEVRPDFAAIRVEIQAVEQRIRQFFFNNLFLSVLNEGKQMTAQEVARRHEEKLVMLGPVLERLDAEFLDPVIDRVFDIATAFDLLPDPPEEIQGTDLKIEYISLLSQAQKMVGTSAIDQLTGFITAVAGAKPDVLDKFDADQAVDEYASMLGTPPTVVVSDDKVQAARDARAQAAQMQQMAAMAQPAAQAATAAKTLGETTAEDGTALKSLMAAM